MTTGSILGLLLHYGLPFLLLMPAIIVHEVSHGWVSYLLGDPTAKNAGRLSFNPLKHIDPFGTILLPILLLLGSGGRVAFGYAKPVPIDPRYYHNHRVGVLLTGLAGPASNILLAIVAGGVFRLVGPEGWLGYVLYYFVTINLVLVFFNLIPIPPLDGSRVIPIFLSDKGLRTYYQVEQYGFVIVLAILWLVPMIFHVDPIATYLNYTVDPLVSLITGL